MASIEAIWAALSDASKRLAFSLQASDLECLARPTWFFAELAIYRDSVLSDLPNFDSDTDSAVRLAGRIRGLLGQDDLAKT